MIRVVDIKGLTDLSLMIKFLEYIKFVFIGRHLSYW